MQTIPATGLWDESPGRLVDVEDIDECLTQSTCPVGVECFNTPGSYNCAGCKNGFTKNNEGACIKVQEQSVILSINENYHLNYNNTASKEFSLMAKKVEVAMDSVYRNNENYVKAEVMTLRRGSVLAEYSLYFKTSGKISIAELIFAVQNNELVGLSVNKDGLKILYSGSCLVENRCLANSRCIQIRKAFYICECNKNYYQNGTHCEGYIEIDAEISIEQVFTKDLENNSSAAYQRLENDTIKELTIVFNQTKYFHGVIITGFSNGSVKIHFKVIYRKPPPGAKEKSRKVVVAITLKQEAKDGFIQNLKLAGDIQIQEPPPPPRNISSRDRKESQFVVEWRPPELFQYFPITSYVITYRTTSGKEKRIETSSSGENNQLIDGLKSDTFYIITANGKNKYGNGDKTEEITVKTLKKKDDNTVLIVTVVVVVVVVIVFVLVVILLRRRRSNRQVTGVQEYSMKKKQDDAQ